MKVMTILGTRPEIIRLSLIIKKLDRFADAHVLVHTGQNYNRNLSELFFEQMDVRQPDYHITGKVHSFGEQVGQMFQKVEKIIWKERPDRILVLGDTNSALCAVLGERLGIPVYHMEAGNRCYDLTVPEEINRKIIDSVSTFNLPYTSLSRENLLREGIPPHRIWVSGNPIYEVLQFYAPIIDSSKILEELRLQESEYIVVTAHRAENVDNEQRLKNIIDGLNLVADRLRVPILCSVHPRTRERLLKYNLHSPHDLVQLHEPFGFLEFIKLQKHAMCVITDSGTVQEESCIFRVPAVTIRQSTERPETVKCGSNVVSGLDPQRIAKSVELMVQTDRNWNSPEGYEDANVSDKVVHFILGGVTHV